MKEYPEIQRLKEYFEHHTIKFKKGDSSVREDFFPISLRINAGSWDIYIDDEYGDFSEKSPLMCLFLVFSSLEIYLESDDFLSWAKLNDLDSSDKHWLAYYISLDNICKEIETHIGKIDSCIPQYDYQLRTGIIRNLT